MGPLQGVKVVEMAGIGPISFAGMTLADLGAEVTRIERPSKGGVAWGASPVMRARSTSKRRRGWRRCSGWSRRPRSWSRVFVPA
jgi:crotonobetainyl-CoA:carnitine CoA-transferase CaiB-like acyl-CoA transferase